MASEEDKKLFEQTIYEQTGTKYSKILSQLIDEFIDNCKFP